MAEPVKQPAPDVPLLFLLLLAGLAALGPFSIDMYLPGFPELAREYGVDAAAVQGTLSFYLLGLSLGQVVYGPLIDRWGRRGPLLGGLVLYALASLAAGWAPDIGWLTAARFVQALGGCAGMVVARAVLRDMFGPRDMARVLSLVLLVMGVAPIVAPLLGSVVIDLWGWRAVFVCLAGYGAAVALGVGLGLEETLRAPSLDLSPARIARTYLGLLRERVFLGYALAGGLAQSGMFAYIAASSFVYIEVFGLSPAQFSLVFGLNAAGLIGGSQVNARLLRGSSPERLLPPVLAVYTAAGLWTAVAALSGLGGVVGVSIGVFVALCSLGFCLPNSTAAAMGPVGDRAGMASALMGTVQFGLAGLSSYLTGRWFDGTALPMAAVIFGSGLLALLALRSLVQEPRALD